MRKQLVNIVVLCLAMIPLVVGCQTVSGPVAIHDLKKRAEILEPSDLHNKPTDKMQTGTYSNESVCKKLLSSAQLMVSQGDYEKATTFSAKAMLLDPKSQMAAEMMQQICENFQGKRAILFLAMLSLSTDKQIRDLAAQAILSSDRENILSQLLQELEKKNVGFFGSTLNDMSHMSELHTACMLGDGRVLLLGDEEESGPAASISGMPRVTMSHTSVEYYNPKTMFFERLPTPKFYVGASHGRSVLLQNGHCFLLGIGKEEKWLFSPKENKFISCPDSAHVSVRRWPAVNLLPDGRVLITGGSDDDFIPLSSVEIYNPDTGKWKINPASMRVARVNHQATELSDKRILITGGETTGELATKTAEIFDPLSREFSVIQDKMSQARTDHAAVLLKNGKVLIAGGLPESWSMKGEELNSAEIFDPNTNRFIAVKSHMEQGRSGHCGILLNDGRVLIIGGGQRGNGKVELFDPTKTLFLPVHVPMRCRRRQDFTATKLNDGTVLIAGGRGHRDSGPYTYLSTEIYYPPDKVQMGFNVYLKLFLLEEK